MDVEVTGKLETGVVAIGGETTGIVVRAPDGVWELDCGQDAELKRTCEKLNGEKVRVVGKARKVPGVEGPERRLIRVAKLTASD